MGFNIHIEGDYYLETSEVWPDGDAPAEPTAEHVKDIMKSRGRCYSVLHDWGLLRDLSVDVDGVLVWP